MLPKVEIYDAADELKVIVYNKDDLQFAEKQAVGVSNTCKLYLQPEWSRRDSAIPLIVSHVLENPKWMASLQTHKYLKIP
jgi:organic radical activating enzyme